MYTYGLQQIDVALTAMIRMSFDRASTTFAQAYCAVSNEG